jgi:hypothetical protein
MWLTEKKFKKRDFFLYSPLHLTIYIIYCLPDRFTLYVVDNPL